MSKKTTAKKQENECTEKEYRDILTCCQKIVFRDIWRLTDADVAIKLVNTLQRALPDDLDWSSTLNLNKLSSLLRNTRDPQRCLEFCLHSRPDFAVAMWKLCEEERSARATKEATAQPVGEEAAAV